VCSVGLTPEVVRVKMRSTITMARLSRWQSHVEHNGGRAA